MEVLKFNEDCCFYCTTPFTEFRCEVNLKNHLELIHKIFGFSWLAFENLFSKSQTLNMCPQCFYHYSRASDKIWQEIYVCYGDTPVYIKNRDALVSRVLHSVETDEYFGTTIDPNLLEMRSTIFTCCIMHKAYSLGFDLDAVRKTISEWTATPPPESERGLPKNTDVSMTPVVPQKTAAGVRYTRVRRDLDTEKLYEIHEAGDKELKTTSAAFGASILNRLKRIVPVMGPDGRPTMNKKQKKIAPKYVTRLRFPKDVRLKYVPKSPIVTIEINTPGGTDKEQEPQKADELRVETNAKNPKDMPLGLVPDPAPRKAKLLTSSPVGVSFSQLPTVTTEINAPGKVFQTDGQEYQKQSKLRAEANNTKNPPSRPIVRPLDPAHPKALMSKSSPVGAPQEPPTKLPRLATELSTPCWTLKKEASKNSESDHDLRHQIANSAQEIAQNVPAEGPQSSLRTSPRGRVKKVMDEKTWFYGDELDIACKYLLEGKGDGNEIDVEDEVGETDDGDQNQRDDEKST